MSLPGVQLSVLLYLLYFLVVVVAAVVKVVVHVGSRFGTNGLQNLVGRKLVNACVLT
jgi:hypothetical protein